jgi:hypothetical protein
VGGRGKIWTVGGVNFFVFDWHIFFCAVDGDNHIFTIRGTSVCMHAKKPGIPNTMVIENYLKMSTAGGGKKWWHKISLFTHSRTLLARVQLK